MGLRRLRPALPLRVWMREGEPWAFATREQRFQVTAAYGPWRASGSWWASAWDMEEWDVLAAGEQHETLTCLVVHDRSQDTWQLEAVYD